MQILPDPVGATGQEPIEPGQLVLLGLDTHPIEALTHAARVLGMRCAIASCFDECAGYALGVGPTVYATTESCFHPRLVSLADPTFRRTTLLLLGGDAERLPFWRLIAWDVIEPGTPSDRLIVPLTVARTEAQRRLRECQLIEDVRRRQTTLSENEHRVLKAICEGRLNKQIASEQGVSVRTIEQRRRRVFEKMGVQSAVPLAAKMAVVEALERQASHAAPPASLSPPSKASPGKPTPPKPKLPVGLFQGGAIPAVSVDA